jgi:predicted O-linked N-acetylglucosamine transferase (SPINDLY family)
MGIEEGVASSAEDYVQTAVRLGGNPEGRAALKVLIAQRKGRLYGQDGWIEPMKAFLREAAL